MKYFALFFLQYLVPVLLFGQNKEIDKKLSNQLNNNRYLIDYYKYYTKKPIQDSIYYFLNDNFNHLENLFFLDYLILGKYYLEVSDTNKAELSINYAIMNGLDSIDMDRNYSKILFYSNYLRNNIIKNYNFNYCRILKECDSSTVILYDLMDELDQTIRKNIIKYKGSDIEENYSILSRIADSLNFIQLKKLISENKGIGISTVGNPSKYLGLLLHNSDYNEDDYNYLLNYMKKQVMLNNISMNDLIYLIKRHLRDNKGYNFQNAFLTDKQIQENDVCDELEKYWLDNGYGSFKIFYKSRNIHGINCNE